MPWRDVYVSSTDATQYRSSSDLLFFITFFILLFAICACVTYPTIEENVMYDRRAPVASQQTRAYRGINTQVKLPAECRENDV